MAFLPLVVASSLFLLPLLYLFFRSGTEGATGNAPGPPPGPPKQLPVLGNLLQLGSRPHRYFQAVARRYGPVVQVQLGRVRMVVVASAEAAEEVLRTNDLHCCSRPDSPGMFS